MEKEIPELKGKEIEKVLHCSDCGGEFIAIYLKGGELINVTPTENSELIFSYPTEDSTVSLKVVGG